MSLQPDDLTTHGVTLEVRAAHDDAGEVWWGRDTTTGERLRIRWVRVQPAMRDTAQVRAAAVSVVGHPHLLALARVIPTASGLALVTRRPDGVSLPDLVRRQAGLGDGELVTLCAPLAEALAALHRAGVTGVRLQPDSVWVDRSGRPLLLDAAVQPPSPDGGEHADVQALQRLCLSTAGSPNGPAAALLAHFSGTAEQLAVALLGATEPQPLGWTRKPTAADDEPAPPRVSHRRLLPRPRVRPAVVAAAVAGVLLAAGVGWASARVGPLGSGTDAAAPPVPAATVGPPAVDWRQVLDRLDRRRSLAFADPLAGGLRAVDFVGGPAYASDEATRRRLVDAKAHAVGLSALVESVTVVSGGPDRVVLTVADRLSAYRIVDDGGAVLESRSARGLKRWRVWLVRAGSGWLIRDVVAA